jgi:hypothetical protein
MDKPKRKAVEKAENEKLLHQFIDKGNNSVIDKIWQLPSTSNWETEHLKALNINYININNINNILDNYNILNNYNIFLSNYWNSKNKFILSDDDKQFKENYDKIEDKKIQTIVDKIGTIIIDEKANKIDESSIDDFVRSLFYYLGFDENPLKIISKKIEIKINNNKIISKPDLSIANRNNILLMIIEDKHSKNSNYIYNYSEPQIGGEIFCAAINNILNINIITNFPIIIFAIRIITTSFTFFKAIISEEYIKEAIKSNEKLPLKNSLSIYKYPQYNIDNKPIEPGLNFCLYEQRNEIINILLNIKNYYIKSFA